MRKITDEKVELVLSIFHEKVREYAHDFRRSDKPSGFWKEKYGTNLHSTGLGEAWAMRAALAAASALTAGEREPVATLTRYTYGHHEQANVLTRSAANALPHGTYPLYTSPPASELDALRKERDEALIDARTYKEAHEGMGEIAERELRHARDAEARLAEALKEIRWAHDTLYEINPSNYDHDEVCKLNSASVEVILGLATMLGEKHGKSDARWADLAARRVRDGG